MRFSYLENVAYFCDLIHNEKTLSHAEHKPHRKECLFPCANSDPFVRKRTFLPLKLKILRMDATKIYSRLRFWYIAWKNNLAICLHLEYDYFHRPTQTTCQTTWQTNNLTMFLCTKQRRLGLPGMNNDNKVSTEFSIFSKFSFWQSFQPVQ